MQPTDIGTTACLATSETDGYGDPDIRFDLVPGHPVRNPSPNVSAAAFALGTRMPRAHRGMFWPLCLQCSFQKSADQPSRLSLVVWDLAPSNAWDLFAASGAFEATVEVVKRALLLPPPANPTTH